MVKTIYVGNLPFSATSSDVGNMFAPYGPVLSVHLIYERETGRPRGFGFVEMDDDNALSAIEALNSTEMGGRSLRINEARTREDCGGRRLPSHRREY
jgi:RNA recognition motif-containing protein